MDGEFIWQFYVVKCNDRYFVKFDADKDEHVVPVLTEKLENETVKLFSLVSEAKEICNICSNHKYVSSFDKSRSYDVWSIVAVNRMSVSCECEGCCHEVLREVGTVWSLDV